MLDFRLFGDKEQEAGAVSVRVSGKGDQGSCRWRDYIAKAEFTCCEQVD
jgi:threonyl-tRNA synthetase